MISRTAYRIRRCFEFLIDLQAGLYPGLCYTFQINCPYHIDEKRSIIEYIEKRKETHPIVGTAPGIPSSSTNFRSETSQEGLGVQEVI